jgi:hypothetical protein
VDRALDEQIWGRARSRCEYCTGIEHVLVGSVAENVVRHAPCPVLVARRRIEVHAARGFAM